MQWQLWSLDGQIQHADEASEPTQEKLAKESAKPREDAATARPVRPGRRDLARRAGRTVGEVSAAAGGPGRGFDGQLRPNGRRQDRRSTAWPTTSPDSPRSKRTIRDGKHTVVSGDGADSTRKRRRKAVAVQGSGDDRPPPEPTQRRRIPPARAGKRVKATASAQKPRARRRQMNQRERMLAIGRRRRRPCSWCCGSAGRYVDRPVPHAPAARSPAWRGTSELRRKRRRAGPEGDAEAGRIRSPLAAARIRKWPARSIKTGCWPRSRRPA